MNQALIDEIVSGVLAQLQPAPSRPVRPTATPATSVPSATSPFTVAQAMPRSAATVTASPVSLRPVTSPVPLTTAMPATPTPATAAPAPVSSVPLPAAAGIKAHVHRADGPDHHGGSARTNRSGGPVPADWTQFDSHPLGP